MWIVKLALDGPYTFVVAAILILFLGTAAIINTPTDIFPNIDIPVISVIWTYTGLPAQEVEKRITVYSEFVLAIVNDIRSIESQTLNGVATLKIYFNPQVRVDAATVCCCLRHMAASSVRSWLTSIRTSCSRKVSRRST